MKFFLIIAFIFISSNIPAQNNTDSIVIQYLRSLPNIPAPFMNVIQKGKEKIRSSNYFVEPNLPISKDTIKIATFLFGSTASHSSKYFLIQVFISNKFFYKIIDNPILEEAIKSFFSFIKPYNLPDTDKAVLLNQLSYTYY